MRSHDRSGKTVSFVLPEITQFVGISTETGESLALKHVLQHVSADQ